MPRHNLLIELFSCSSRPCEFLTPTLLSLMNASFILYNVHHRRPSQIHRFTAALALSRVDSVSTGIRVHRIDFGTLCAILNAFYYLEFSYARSTYCWLCIDHVCTSCSPLFAKAPWDWNQQMIMINDRSVMEATGISGTDIHCSSIHVSPVRSV